MAHMGLVLSSGIRLGLMRAWGETPYLGNIVRQVGAGMQYGFVDCGMVFARPPD
jgi:hypothetical protein